MSERRKLRVLIVEDSPKDAQLLEALLEDSEYACACDIVDSLVALQDRLNQSDYDVIICDYHLRGWTALEAIEIVTAAEKDIPLIVVSGTVGDEEAAEVIKQGAADYVLKDRLARLPSAIDRALELWDLRAGRRRSHEILQQSERRLKEVYEHVADVIFYLRVEPGNQYRFVSVNPAFYKTTRLSEGQVEGKLVQEVIPEASLPLVLGKYAEAIQLRKTVQYEETSNYPSGTIVGVVSITPVYDAEQRPLYLIGSAHDITERKQAEEQNRLHVAALEAAANSIVITDRDGNILWVNIAFSALTGYSREEAVGSKTSLLKSGQHDQRFYADLWQTIQNGQIWQGEMLNRRKDGTVYPEEMTITPVRDRGGRINRFIAIKQDITERKRAEEALLESQRLFNDMLERLQLVSLMLDRDARITYCNEFLLELTGWRREEVMGRDWFELFIPPEAEDVRDTFANLIANLPSAWHHVNPILTRSGKQRLIQWNNVALRSPSGEIIGTASIGEDITQRKELERQLVLSQRMEAVGRLAGGIAHDFNNLLGVMLGYSDLVIEKLEPTHSLQPRMQQIKKAAERAAELTKQLLAFSRRQVMEPSLVNLNEIVEEMHQMLPRLLGTDIEFRLQLETHLGWVKADVSQMGQVLMNLAVNARDAMPSGGRLTIATSNVDADDDYVRQHVLVSPGPYVVLTVTDTGHGMDKETQQRIFDPFFTTKEKGTGLGLATTYGIVKQSGGFIWVYSEPGEGTMFKVYLPRVEEGARRVAPAAQQDSFGPRTETILLVEDEIDLRQLVWEWLEMSGHHVLVAESTADALHIAESFSGPIDLILTDVVMPGMNGPELVRRLSALKPAAKVLFMSGYADRSVFDGDAISGEAAFLAKPFTRVVLLRKLREVLGGK